MKKFLLGMACAVSLSSSAHAQGFLVPGTDINVIPSGPGPGFPSFDLSNSLNWWQQLFLSSNQLGQLVQTYNEVVQVYTQAENIWNSVHELVGANQWTPALLDGAMRNPLPFGAAEHPGWVGGFNDPAGLPFGAQYLTQNTVGGDISVYDQHEFAGAEIVKMVRSLSSIQAVSTNHLATIEGRVAGLADLFNNLAAIGTVQETDSLSARLNSELSFAMEQQNQATQTMSAAQLQLAVFDSNQRQWQYQDEAGAQEAICEASHAGGSTLQFAACQ